MTASDVLYQAEAAGCTVRIRDGKPTVDGKPNAALLAALKDHREGILDILLGPETCEICNGWVHPENGRADIGLLCTESRCPFKGARHGR